MVALRIADYPPLRAATIWTVGAIGLACGLGQFGLALLITLIAWLVLVGMGSIERRWLGHADKSPHDPEEPPTS